MEPDKGKIIDGLLLCWGLNILQIFVGGILLALSRGSENFTGAFVIGGIRFLQLIYVLPVCFQFRKQSKSDTTTGIVIAASITALLNATCWGLIRGGL